MLVYVLICANHSCGHDGHMTRALGTILLLKEQVQLNGAVRVIFQPAEEKGGGALKVIEQGVVDELRCLDLAVVYSQGYITRIGRLMLSD